MSEAGKLGEITDYPSMMRVLRERANELHINRSDPDTATITGLPEKYLTKLLGPRPVRRIGMKSMGAVLGGLRIKFIVVIDDEAERLYQLRARRHGMRMPVRDERLVRNGVVQQEFSRNHYRKMGRKGGPNSRKFMTKRRARQLARNAAHMRWDRIKAVAKGEAT